jgi:hypothetical protein
MFVPHVTKKKTNSSRVGDFARKLFVLAAEDLFDGPDRVGVPTRSGKQNYGVSDDCRRNEAATS